MGIFTMKPYANIRLESITFCPIGEHANNWSVLTFIEGQVLLLEAWLSLKLRGNDYMLLRAEYVQNFITSLILLFLTQVRSRLA